MGYDKTTAGIRAGKGIVCKPFKNTHLAQLELISDLSWFYPEALSNVEDLIKNTLTQKGAEEYMDVDRIEAICTSVRGRIQTLSEFAPQENRDTVSDDRTKDEAATY